MDRTPPRPQDRPPPAQSLPNLEPLASCTGRLRSLGPCQVDKANFGHDKADSRCPAGPLSPPGTNGALRDAQRQDGVRTAGRGIHLSPEKRRSKHVGAGPRGKRVLEIGTQSSPGCRTLTLLALHSRYGDKALGITLQ